MKALITILSLFFSLGLFAQTGPAPSCKFLSKAAMDIFVPNIPDGQCTQAYVTAAGTDQGLYEWSVAANGWVRVGQDNSLSEVDQTLPGNRNVEMAGNDLSLNEGKVLIKSSLTDVITYANLSAFIGAGWTHGGGSQHTGGGVDVLTITNDLVDKATYEVSLDIGSYTTGAIRLYVNGAWSERFFGNASFKDTIRVRTDTNIKVIPTADFDGSISNFAIKVLVSGNLVVEKQIETTSLKVNTGQIDVDEPSHIAIGYNALRNSAEDIYNIPSSNIGIGHFAGNIGNGTVLGYRAGQENEELGVITAVGKWALQLNTTGHASAFGNAALRSNTTSNSHAFGDEALAFSTTGQNDAFGYYAGHAYTGSESSFFGYQSGRTAISGIKTLVGFNSGYSSTSANLTAVGHNAGRGWATGSGVAIGRDAGYNIFGDIPVNDSRGVLIGDFSGRTVPSATVLTDYIAIGHAASVDKSYQVVIARDGNLENKFYGTIKWDATYLNADGSQSENQSMWSSDDGDLYYEDEASIVYKLNGDTNPTNEIEIPAGGNNLDFLQTDGAGNYSWVAQASGADNLGNHTATQDLQMSGNELDNVSRVGIGTSFPTYAIEGTKNTAGTDGVYFRNSNAGTTGKAFLAVQNNTSLGAEFAVHSSAHSVWPNTTLFTSQLSGGLTFWQSGAANIDFWTNSTKRFTIESDGDVGIGIAAPTSKLHVVGTTFLNGAITSGGALDMGAFSIGNAGSIGFVDVSGNRNRYWKTNGTSVLTAQIGIPQADITDAPWTKVGTNVSTSTLTDNIGIGTATPSEGLHMKGKVLRIEGEGANSAFDGILHVYGGSTLEAGTERHVIVDVISAGDLIIRDDTEIQGNLTLESSAYPSSTTTALAITQNNFTPTNWATEQYHKVNPSAAISITGLGSLPDGTIRCLTNIGNSTAVLEFNDAGSIDANKIGVAPGYLDYNLTQGSTSCLRYDTDINTGRWILLE